MRRRGLIAVVVLVAGFLVLRGVAAWRDTESSVERTPAKAAPAFAERTIKSGAVTVKIEPTRIDAAGAEFRVAFDTHSFDLGLDVARHAHLTVGDKAWTASTWSGDGPGGHHRAGTLHFSPSGAPTGTAELHLDGLPTPVTATWPVNGA